MMRRIRSRLISTLAALFFHCTVAYIVASVIAVLFSAPIAAAFAAIPRLEGVVQSVASPFFWGPGAILGFVMNKGSKHRVACWVWFPGVVFLVYAIRQSMRHYDPQYFRGCSGIQETLNAFFILDPNRCGGASSTLAGFFFTLPALSAVAYSIGATNRIAPPGQN